MIATRDTKWIMLFKRQNSEKGFTFIELMAVLALLGLLYSFALPSLKTSFEKRNTAFGSWFIANAKNFKTLSKGGGAEFYMYIDLDSETVWTGTDKGEKNKNARKLEGDTNIISVEFISGLRVDSGVVRIAFFRGGYSDGVIIHTNEDGKSLSYRMDPFLDDVPVISGHASWEG